MFEYINHTFYYTVNLFYQNLKEEKCEREFKEYRVIKDVEIDDFLENTNDSNFNQDLMFTD